MVTVYSLRFSSVKTLFPWSLVF